MRERMDKGMPDGSQPTVHGWCPSAWRPMMAGDGLLVRVRPMLGRMTAAQALGLCDAANAFGNGVIDITNRAALQIRGVAEAGLGALLEHLLDLHLIAADPAMEARPAILVAPDWTPGDGTEAIVLQLAARLGELPPLPGKVGFAIDVAGAPILVGTAADFRVERDAAGGLLVRAEGRRYGVPVSEATAVDTILALATCFADSGGSTAGRMARHAAPLPAVLTGTTLPAPGRSLTTDIGPVHGVPFGRMDADRFAALVRASGARSVRIAPSRRIILEGGVAVKAEGFVPPDDRSLRVDACTGAPACPQATVETRALALRLAPHIVGSLHVSGCAKGCARPSRADLVLTGRQGAFDLGFDARAGDVAQRPGLDPNQILTLLGAA